ncbi:MAG: hypothetical protein Q9157_004606, partial [Trypethelium eluteriae]
VKDRVALLGDKVDFKEEFNKLESKADALLAKSEQNAKELKDKLEQEAKESRNEAKADAEKHRLEAREDVEKYRLEEKAERDAEKVAARDEKSKKEQKDKEANDELKAWMKEQNKGMTEKFQVGSLPTGSVPISHKNCSAGVCEAHAAVQGGFERPIP